MPAIPIFLAEVSDLGIKGKLVLHATLKIKPVNPREINPEYSTLEGLMLKLTLQYFGHLMRRAD